MKEFRVPNIGEDPQQNIPSASEFLIRENPVKTDLESAHQECKSAAEELADKTSGYGKLPAERYLLRFEYGFTGKELEKALGVSLSTISKQTLGMRREILRFPALSRIVGRFRASRAELNKPNLKDSCLFDSEVKLYGRKVDTTVTLQHGDPGCPYSWKYTLRARMREEELQKHVKVDYLVDAEYGVLIKRLLRGISYSLDQREPYYQPKRQYFVYPLPHQKIIRTDGTLMDAIQYHSAHDLDLGYMSSSWDQLESKLDSNRYEKPRSPGYSEGKTLLDRLKLTGTMDPISDYSREKHLRDNLEHLLRVYPLEDLNELPSETIDLLWNGSLEEYDLNGDAHNALSKALETSEVHRSLTNKGY